MDDRTTRTAVILLGLGVVTALVSLFVQGMLLKKLPPEKRQAVAAKAAAAAGAPAPPALNPLAPPQPAPGPEPPRVSDSAKACREKLGACLTANGKALSPSDTLGSCYALCVGATGPCDKKSCGDLCEASFGLTETCR